VQHWDSMVGQFVMVCPNARFDPLAGETRWQVPRVGDLAIPTVDLAFVEALLACLATTGRVDMQRVYASGFSSGAAMTWQLTVLNRSVNRFRGFAPVSHVVNTTQVALGDAAAMNNAQAAGVRARHCRHQLVADHPEPAAADATRRRHELDCPQPHPRRRSTGGLLLRRWHRSESGAQGRSICRGAVVSARSGRCWQRRDLFHDAAQ
jgi:poly(3-hydroxybutyrate) depolymerase